MKVTSFIRIFFFFAAVQTVTTGQGQSQNTYAINGQIIDGETGKPLPFAQVALSEPGKETPVSFNDTDEQDHFILNSEGGTFKIPFILLDYSETEQAVVVKGNMDLGKVELESENHQLEEVVVRSEKVPIRADVEGMTINPERILSNTGGTLSRLVKSSFK